MLDQNLTIKLENIKKLMKNTLKPELQNILSKIHPTDIAIISTQLSTTDRKKIWKSITPKQRLAETILVLDEDNLLIALDEIEPKTVASLLVVMSSNDSRYIFKILPLVKQQKFIKLLKKKDAIHVEKLLHYKEDTAGAIMNTDSFSLNINSTVKEATKLLHNAEYLDMPFYLYVTDDNNKLVGILSLRQLILNTPTKKLADIMIHDVITVNITDTREHVANRIDKYGLLAIPVIDEQHRLCGIVTVEDIIDFIRYKTSENIYAMAGINQVNSSFINQPIKSSKARLPWLIVAFAGELISGIIITYYQGNTKDFLILAIFIPIIMAMGGNVGSQSATVIIRGISTGVIDLSYSWKLIFNEIKIGLIIGVVLGILLAIIAPLLNASPTMGFVIGIALFMATIFSALTGAIVPLTLIKLKFDPAVGAGPFISTLNDITGLTIYFAVSIALLQIL